MLVCGFFGLRQKEKKKKTTYFTSDVTVIKYMIHNTCIILKFYKLILWNHLLSHTNFIAIPISFSVLFASIIFTIQGWSISQHWVHLKTLYSKFIKFFLDSKPQNTQSILPINIYWIRVSMELPFEFQIFQMPSTNQ